MLLGRRFDTVLFSQLIWTYCWERSFMITVEMKVSRTQHDVGILRSISLLQLYSNVIIEFWTLFIVQNLRFSRRRLWIMSTSGKLRRVVLVRTRVSEKRKAPIIKVTRIGKLGTLTVTRNWTIKPILITLMMQALHSSETSILTTAKLRNIPEHDILHGRRREYLKSYMR
jgi:hypothetical protein